MDTSIYCVRRANGRFSSFILMKRLTPFVGNKKTHQYIESIILTIELIVYGPLYYKIFRCVAGTRWWVTTNQNKHLVRTLCVFRDYRGIRTGVESPRRGVLMHGEYFNSMEVTVNLFLYPNNKKYRSYNNVYTYI